MVHDPFSRLRTIERVKHSEVQTAFAGSFCHSLDTAVIDECATVEYDILDASLDATLCNQLAYDSCCCNVGAGLSEPRRSASSVEADASVLPATSSMI